MLKEFKKYIIDPTRAKCKKCKSIWDLETIQKDKNYIPGICPGCGGFLFRIKEYIK